MALMHGCFLCEEIMSKRRAHKFMVYGDGYCFMERNKPPTATLPCVVSSTATALLSRTIAYCILNRVQVECLAVDY